MPGILEKIVARKREEIGEREARLSLAEIRKQAVDSPPTRGFTSAIRRAIDAGGSAVIAEIKRASPSQGTLRKNFSPRRIARAYEAAGATCLSVLTDVDFFQGSDADLQAARAASHLPVLRKDFVVAPYQVYETKALGADCMLVIVSVLADGEMREIVDIAGTLGLDVLVEVHNRKELERGLMLCTPLIGINNRDLHTFVTDLQTTIKLLPHILYDRTMITESGIYTREDVVMMHRHGVKGFLIGEALMRADNPGEKLRELFLT